jgi:hypothetical protein
MTIPVDAFPIASLISDRISTRPLPDIRIVHPVPSDLEAADRVGVVARVAAEAVGLGGWRSAGGNDLAECLEDVLVGGGVAVRHDTDIVG